MKLAAAALVLLAGLLAASAQNALSKLERTRFSGAEYVRLADWAGAYHFQIAWTRRTEEVQLTNSGSKLVFTMDSHKADINGVAILLSAPLAVRHGSAYISLLDLQTAVNPVVFTPKDLVRGPIVSVCLDPGHGGKDPGNEEGRWQEKQLTLLLAREVRDLLIGAGLKVTLTRNGDQFVPLAERTEIARRRASDLFVSLHFNAVIAEKDQVQGVEVYCLTPAGASSTNARGDSADFSAFAGNRFDERNMVLAYQIQKAMVRTLALEDRGVKRARFVVLRQACVPSALVEAGFMSHPQESKRIIDPRYRRQMARAIADGILAYKRLVER